MKIIFKTYNLLLLFATALLVVSFFIPAIDLSFNMGSTYYVLTNIQWLRFFVIVLFVMALLYRVLDRFLMWNILSLIHIIGTIILFFMVFYLNYDLHKSVKLIELTSENPYGYYEQGFMRLSLAILFFLIFQLLPIINLLTGLINMRKLHK